VKDGFANHEIVTVAVYLLGGQTTSVDTEDIAVKANEIAPGRFTWRKYPDQINIDTVRKRLWDAMRPEKGAYLIGSEKSGWSLTERGRRFAESHVQALGETNLSRRPLSAKDRNWARAEKARMLVDRAFGKYVAGTRNAITPQEAEGFFRLDDYVMGVARQRKLNRILNIFGDDPELGQAVQDLAAMVRERQ